MRDQVSVETQLFLKAQPCMWFRHVEIGLARGGVLVEGISFKDIIMSG